MLPAKQSIAPSKASHLDHFVRQRSVPLSHFCSAKTLIPFFHGRDLIFNICIPCYKTPFTVIEISGNIHHILTSIS